MSDMKKKPVAVGFTKTAKVLERFKTLVEAEAWIKDREKVDPNGVKNGEYFIDAPEEMLHG